MDTRPRTSLISFCTVQLRTLCAAHSLVTLCLSMTSGRDPGELPGFWGSMVFRHAPIPRKGSGKQQQLQDRIKQHVPQWLRQELTCPRRFQPRRSCKGNDTKLVCGSAIGQHLLENDQCALNYDNKRFPILATAPSSFHLNLLEATYIKTRRLMLCRQKEFVYTLRLF